jgi:hypothetical protein
MQLVCSDHRDNLLAGNAAFRRNLSFQREPRMDSRDIRGDIYQGPVANLA